MVADCHNTCENFMLLPLEEDGDEERISMEYIVYIISNLVYSI